MGSNSILAEFVLDVLDFKDKLQMAKTLNDKVMVINSEDMSQNAMLIISPKGRADQIQLPIDFHGPLLPSVTNDIPNSKSANVSVEKPDPTPSEMNEN